MGDYSDPDIYEEVEVAIKILNQVNRANQDKVLRAAMKEVETIKSVEDKIASTDCFVKVYGVAYGQPPLNLRKEMNVAEFTSVIGIVMRYEGGGSLQTLIYKRDEPLPIMEKLRLLKSVARGLAELHAIGIVHADIKPDNVLLSHHTPPEIRLADFGLATMREDSMGGNMSTLQETSHARGTPIYSAPEMLFNPYGDNTENTVAKPSRKSDVYAFAILAWELLAEKRPFAGAANEIMLSAMIHQGERPSLAEVPSDCPKKVVDLIEACWQTNRQQRKLAVECYSILQYQFGLLVKTDYDIFISHDFSTSALSGLVAYKLMQAGFHVCFNQQTIDGSTHGEEDDERTIFNSKIFLLIANQSYQDNERCIYQLKTAKRVKPEPPIIPLFVEAEPLVWSSQDFKFLCQLRSPTLVSYNLADIASDPSWHSADDEDGGPSTSVLVEVDERVKKISEYLKLCLEGPLV